MAIIGKIKQMFSDSTRTAPVFPITVTSAITDADGNNLDDILANINPEVTAENVQMASGMSLEQTLASCWISFTDADGNPTEEPQIHWLVDEEGNVVTTGLTSAEEVGF